MKSTRISRRMWVRAIFKKRWQQGEYHHLVQEMRLQDIESFFRYFRMTPQQFDRLLRLTRNKRKKKISCRGHSYGLRLRKKLNSVQVLRNVHDVDGVQFENNAHKSATATQSEPLTLRNMCASAFMSENREDCLHTARLFT